MSVAAASGVRATLARELLAMLVTCAILVAGCGKKTEPTSAEPAVTPAAPATTAADSAPAEPAPVVTHASWAPEALEELLAPIALYPDLLLGQILAASVNSQEVLDGGNWLLQNQELEGAELDAAAQNVGFGSAMRALLHFPSVVDMMCQEIAWTRQLGAAFTSDQQAVLDAVQRLRAQAVAIGSFASTAEQKVETITENEQVIVEVKPAEPEVIYVPEYDPEVVYGYYGGYYGVYDPRLVAFGVGVIIGHALRNDWYYPIWSYGAIYLGPRPFYPPAYAYRPKYGAALRPAVGYTAPAGYRHSYNNVRVDANRKTVANSAKYYDRFSGDRNLYRGATRSPLANAKEGAAYQAATRQSVAQTRAAQSAGQTAAPTWKGQSTYAGQRDRAADDAYNQAAAQAAALAQARRADRATAGTANLPAGARPPPVYLSEVRSAPVDRGYGDSNRVANREARVETRVTRETPGVSVDSRLDSSRDSAFSGANRDGNGSFERASSARGHASAGARQGRAGGGGRRR